MRKKLYKIKRKKSEFDSELLNLKIDDKKLNEKYLKLNCKKKF